MVRIRPVPVVFLLLAFMPQLSVIVGQSILGHNIYPCGVCFEKRRAVRVKNWEGGKVIEWH